MPPWRPRAHCPQLRAACMPLLPLCRAKAAARVVNGQRTAGPWASAAPIRMRMPPSYMQVTQRSWLLCERPLARRWDAWTPAAVVPVEAPHMLAWDACTSAAPCMQLRRCLTHALAPRSQGRREWEGVTVGRGQGRRGAIQASRGVLRPRDQGLHRTHSPHTHQRAEALRLGVAQVTNRPTVIWIASSARRTSRRSGRQQRQHGAGEEAAGRSGRRWGGQDGAEGRGRWGWARLAAQRCVQRGAAVLLAVRCGSFSAAQCMLARCPVCVCGAGAQRL